MSAIIAAEIVYRLSGGAATTLGDQALGGAKSANAVPAGGLFDDVTGAESAAGSVEYRCVYIHNANTTPTTLVSPKIYVQTNTPSTDTTIDLALGTSVQGGTEQTIANETTAPTGVSWVTNATNYSTGVALGDIPGNGGHRAVWIRRTVNAGAVAYSDSFTLRVEGDTAP